MKAFFSACGTLDKYIDDAIMAFWRGGISRSMLNAPQRAQGKENMMRLYEAKWESA